MQLVSQLVSQRLNLLRCSCMSRGVTLCNVSCNLHSYFVITRRNYRRGLELFVKISREIESPKWRTEGNKREIEMQTLGFAHANRFTDRRRGAQKEEKSSLLGQALDSKEARKRSLSSAG